METRIKKERAREEIEMEKVSAKRGKKKGGMLRWRKERGRQQGKRA